MRKFHNFQTFVFVARLPRPDVSDEKTTLCERLNDPYYSLNMMRQHLHYFCEKEKSQVDLNH